MFQEQFQKFGLTKTQADVLDYLFENGQKKASFIARAIKHPRGSIYKTLEELFELGLVEKENPQKQVSLFRPKHPRELESILEKKGLELNENKKIFSELLPTLSSSYNLSIGKPGVKFYEGKEGMEKILEDTLKSQTEILLLINTDSLSKEEKFKEINEEYKRKRKRQKIKKRIIRVGEKPEMTFGTSDPDYDQITEIRYLDKNDFSFKASLQIYDGKISYQIIDQEKIISVLMEEKNIFELNRAWFETLWQIAAP